MISIPTLNIPILLYATKIYFRDAFLPNSSERVPLNVWYIKKPNPLCSGNNADFLLLDIFLMYSPQ